MSLYEKNINFIKKYSADLYNVLMGEAKYKVEIEKLESSTDYIMRYNGASCFVHSLYNIDEEMKMTFHSVKNETEAIVLFGFGLGYAIDFIKNNFLNIDRLIVVEPSLDMFKEFLKQNDIYESFKKIKNLTLIINEDESYCSEKIYEAILNYDKIEYVYSLPYRTLFEKYYDKMTSEIINKIHITKGNIVVTNYSWAVWLINSIRNLKINSLAVEDIRTVFKDKPVIIVSAGPSLNKNMHFLEKVKDKGIIIAVGTAIRILDHNNIKPHFRAAFDGTPAEKRIFDDLQDDSIPILYGSKFYYEILPQYKGAKFSMVLFSDYLNKYLYNYSKIDYEVIYQGASIANVITNLACKFQCSKIIFMGQDLCYYNEEAYAKGSGKEVQLDIYRKEFIKDKDIYGNEVDTHHVFLNMKRGLEDSIETYKEVKFINATEGGLNIEGTEIKSMKEVIAEDLQENINFDLEKVLQSIDAAKQMISKKETMDIAIHNLYEDIQKIIHINEERLNFLIKLRKNIDKKLNGSRLKNDLEYIEDFEKKLKKYPFYREVIIEELQEIENTLKMSFGYKGADLMKQILSVEKILSGISLEIQKFAMYTKELIEEYKKE